jgi:hypothetical protein
MKFFKKTIALLTSTVLLAALMCSSVISAGAVTLVTYDDYKYVKIAEGELAVHSYVGTSSKYFFTVPAKPSVNTTTVSVYKNFMKGNTVLESVTLPDTLKEIQQMAFYGCTSLTTFTMPYNLTTIGDNAFQNSGITTIKMNENITSFGESAFSGTGVTSITFPESVTSIGEGAFSNCANLKYVTIPKTVTSIGDSAFNNCSSDLVIYGYKRSIAETYANTFNLKFVALDNTTYGDANGDGKVDIRDATYIQKVIVQISGFEIPSNSTRFLSADVDGNGRISIVDATLIQKYLNFVISVFPVEQ